MISTLLCTSRYHAPCHYLYITHTENCNDQLTENVMYLYKTMSPDFTCWLHACMLSWESAEDNSLFYYTTHSDLPMSTRSTKTSYKLKALWWHKLLSKSLKVKHLASRYICLTRHPKCTQLNTKQCFLSSNYISVAFKPCMVIVRNIKLENCLQKMEQQFSKSWKSPY